MIADIKTQGAPSINEEPLQTPFDNIALGFSGGGFRAASYALGVMSYLNRVTFNNHNNGNVETSLLQQVTYMSSASGGTIATAMYALSSAEGQSFADFYKNLYGQLQEDKLLRVVLDILNDSKEWPDKPNVKKRNIINAFAKAYDRKLFNEKTVKSLTPADSKTHLYEVCFNTTEFYRGLLFRQNIKMKKLPDDADPFFFYGNFVIRLNHEAAANLKLADLLAASSCFPAGFEPIIFPDDFLYENGPDADYYKDNLTVDIQTGGLDDLKFLFGDLPLEQLKKNRDILLHGGDRKQLVYARPPKFGFMDGGITDNMGVDSMMRANERRVDHETKMPEFDLMMANDVGSGFIDPYSTPVASKGLLGSLNFYFYLILAVVMLGGGIALLANGFCCCSALYTYLCLGFGTLLTVGPLLYLLGLGFITMFIHGRISAKEGLNLDKNFSPRITELLLNSFRQTPFNVIKQMISARVSSILMLNTDVFLKRVRQLLYQGFFQSKRDTYRVKGNFINELAFSNDIYKAGHPAKTAAPGRDLQKVAETAFSMGTTLWFDSVESASTHREACLIASGQFTTCYNLLEYIARLKSDDAPYRNFDPSYKRRVDELEQKLMADYKNFNAAPFWLYNQLGKEYGIPDFTGLSADNIPFPKNFDGLI